MESEFPIRRRTDEEGVVVDRPDDNYTYLVGRAGDQFMTKFQCDLCHFRNIKGRDPGADPRDTRVLHFIRRANLDSMWSRKPSTVKTNRGQIKQMLMSAEQFGYEPDEIFPSMGPSPLEDVQGMALATLILEKSLAPGKNEATVQFDTARRWRASFANLWHVSAEGSQGSVAVRGMTKLLESTSPSNALWFERFMEGMHKRMGDKSEPDLALSVELVLELLKRLREELERVESNGGSEDEIKQLILCGVFVALGFCGGLRGEEIMLLDACALLKHHEEAMNHPKYPHVVAPLLGQFKGERGDRYHYMPMAKVTKSGVDLEYWMSRLVTWLRANEIRNGPCFRKNNGDRMRAADIGDLFYTHLAEIQKENKDLIPESVDVFEDYGTSRSMRRSSTSQAVNVRMRSEAIDYNNRWRKFENAQGRTPSLRMQHHYADVKLILNALLEYSSCL